MLYVSGSAFDLIDCILQLNIASLDGAVLYFLSGSDVMSRFQRVTLIGNRGLSIVKANSPMDWTCQVHYISTPHTVTLLSSRPTPPNALSPKHALV